MFRKHIQIVEQNGDRIVMRERPYYFSAIVPAAISSFSVTIVAMLPWPYGFLAIFPTVIFVPMILWLCVESIFQVSRAAGTLQIKRTLFGRVREKEYPAATIAYFFSQRTRNGCRIKMKLVDGAEKMLMLGAVLGPVAEEASALNRYLGAAQSSGVSQGKRYRASPLPHGRGSVGSVEANRGSDTEPRL